jgi:hypothetical protein
VKPEGFLGTREQDQNAREEKIIKIQV